jgi:hypothetical protein
MDWIKILLMVLAVSVVWKLFIKPVGLLLFELLNSVVSFLKEFFNCLIKMLRFISGRKYCSGKNTGPQSHVMVTKDTVIHLN